MSGWAQGFQQSQDITPAVCWFVLGDDEQGVGSIRWLQHRWHNGQVFFASTHRLCLSRFTFQVLIHDDVAPRETWRIWKLIPVRVEGVFGPSYSSSEAIGLGSLPSYDGDTRQSYAPAQHAESERDEFGTVVTEVTVVTTRRRYRVEDA